VLVAVHLDDGVEAFAEGVAVGREADDGEDDAGRGVVGADAEDLRGEARVDVVAGGGARVAGEDCEGGACDAEGGAAVVGIAGADTVRARDVEGRVGRLTGRRSVVSSRPLRSKSWRRRRSSLRLRSEGCHGSIMRPCWVVWNNGDALA